MMTIMNTSLVAGSNWLWNVAAAHVGIIQYFPFIFFALPPNHVIALYKSWFLWVHRGKSIIARADIKFLIS